MLTMTLIDEKYIQKKSKVPNSGVLLHEDKEKAIKPLLDYLRDKFVDELDINNTIEQYEYMFHNDKGTYYYRHIPSQYWLMVCNGKLPIEIEDWKKWK